MIAILLSTYNGERYLAEQLDSILAQDYSDWHLWIRDDGSQDGTCVLLAAYAQRDARISVITDGENLGAKGSFFRLLEQCSNADYWMFADQDDVWFPNKVRREWEMMQMIEQVRSRAVVVHSDAQVVGSDLQMIAPSFWQYASIRPDLVDVNPYYLAFANSVTGCTMLINRQARDLALSMPSQAIMHDAWIALYVLASGGIVVPIYESLLLYRQHENNVCGAGVQVFSCHSWRQNIRVAQQAYRQAKGLIYTNRLSFWWHKICYRKDRQSLPMRIHETDALICESTDVVAMIVIYRTTLEATAAYQSWQACRSCWECVPKLLIYNNSPEIAIPASDDYEVIVASENKMLAAAYNEAFHYAQEAGVKWLLLFDHDTALNEAYVQQMEAAMRFYQRDGSLAMILPRFGTINKQVVPYTYNPHVFHAFGQGLLPALTRTQGCVFTHNSGIGLRVDALEAIGGFDEAYPLDYQDASYLLRLYQAGYEAWVLEAMLAHDLSVDNYAQNMTPARYQMLLEAQVRMAKSCGKRALCSLRFYFFARSIKWLFIGEKRQYIKQTLRMMVR